MTDDDYNSLLHTNETILYIATLHWRVYRKAFAAFLAGAAVLGGGFGMGQTQVLIGAGFLTLSAAAAIDAWWRRKNTRIIVTDKRVIWKRHGVAVNTREINRGKIETVDCEQSVIDRIMDSGSVIVVGTGGSRETVEPVTNPRGLRDVIAIG
jgi:uncharacterized membrane protein YdbT with pleckstrin-like domain